MGSAGKAIASIATGGLSDIVNNETPLSGALGEELGTAVSSIANPGFISGRGAFKAIEDGDWAQAAQYLVDPVTEPGIDYLARGSGKVIGDAVPELVPYYTTLGSIIGNRLAPGFGNLAGYEVGNKMRGGAMGQNPSQTAEQGVKGGAIIGATYLANSLANAALAPATTAGQTVAEWATSTATDLATAEPIINDVADVVAQQAAQNAGNLSVEPALSVAGDLSSAPVGATDTLEQMIQNTVEGASNLPTQVTADPIPLGDMVANSSGTIADNAPNLSSNILEGAKTVGRGLKKGYSLYSKGKQVYDLINSISNLGDTQSISAISAPQISQSSIPVGSLDEDTLGELMRTKGNKHYGAVLA
jgi:hypothetical protein